jgi:hypothetical protein
MIFVRLSVCMCGGERRRLLEVYVLLSGVCLLKFMLGCARHVRRTDQACKTFRSNNQLEYLNPGLIASCSCHVRGKHDSFRTMSVHNLNDKTSRVEKLSSAACISSSYHS